MTVVDGTAGPFDYTAHCTLPDGTALDLGPFPVAEHEATSLGSVPVGAACTVTQHDGDAVISLSGRALDITIAGDQDEVRFVNRLEPRPAHLTVTVEGMDPSVGGELAVDVSCGSVPSHTVGVPVGSTATVSEPGEGASCTIRATAASGTESVGTREFVTSIVSPETNVRFQLRTSTCSFDHDRPDYHDHCADDDDYHGARDDHDLDHHPGDHHHRPVKPLCRGPSQLASSAVPGIPHPDSRDVPRLRCHVNQISRYRRVNVNSASLASMTSATM